MRKESRTEPRKFKGMGNTLSLLGTRKTLECFEQKDRRLLNIIRESHPHLCGFEGWALSLRLGLPRASDILELLEAGLRRWALRALARVTVPHFPRVPRWARLPEVHSTP